MKSKLIIGNLNSPHVRSLVENLRKNDPTLRVDCLSTSYPRGSEAKVENLYYNLISYIWVKLFGRPSGVAWYLGILFWSFFRRNRIVYDSIQIHYIDSLHLMPFHLYKRNSRKVVAVTWGSDIFRSLNVDVLKEILSKCDGINVSTPEMSATVSALIGKELMQTKEIFTCKFGLANLSILRDIDTSNVSRAELFDSLGLSFINSQSVVIVGSNATREQQHLAIIKSLDEHDFSDCHFVFPMTYGGDVNYIHSVKVALEASQLKYTVLNDYLSNEQNAALKAASDYFIQLQTTDALSGATQESLFARSSVIVGDWLPYGTFVDAGIHYTTVKEVRDIGGTLSQLISIKGHDSKLLEKNSDIIWNLSSWQSVVSGWNKI